MSHPYFSPHPEERPKAASRRARLDTLFGPATKSRAEARDYLVGDHDFRVP